MKALQGTLLAPCGALGLVALLVTACDKEAPPPPPLPPAEPAAASAPLELKVLDAGVEEPPEEDKPKGKGGARPGGLAPCCAALQQNATMAPEPTKTYMVQAAAFCSAAAAQGQDRAAAMGMILGMLKGAGLPAACK
jgi:hypothetical protein